MWFQHQTLCDSAVFLFLPQRAVNQFFQRQQVAMSPRATVRTGLKEKEQEQDTYTKMDCTVFYNLNSTHYLRSRKTEISCSRAKHSFSPIKLHSLCRNSRLYYSLCIVYARWQPQNNINKLRSAASVYAHRWWERTGNDPTSTIQPIVINPL